MSFPDTPDVCKESNEVFIARGVMEMQMQI